MAVTPDQQYLIDTKQLNDSEQCCLAVGGVVDVLNSECTYPQFDNTSLPLTEACGVAEDIAESEHSAGMQNGGGFGNWLSGNLGNLTEGFADIWGAINPPPPDTTVNTTIIQQQAEKDKRNKQLLVLGGVVLFIILGVYLIKKRKN